MTRPALARDFTAPRARGIMQADDTELVGPPAAPTGRGELAPYQYRSFCDVCRAVTVHQVIVVAERQTWICTEHQERE